MYAFRRAILAAFSALSLVLCFHSAPSAGAAEMSIGDRAKLAKERAKQSVAFGSKSKGGGGGDNPCSLDIGNVSTGGPGRAPREINVFVQGDVIQANRNCK
ncbi:MAG: hypothetical protein EXR36_01945 [Betaproteobacteria bacterium]|nr:hypothetical protein [Betaproteobacteria bacterium]